MSNFLSPEDCAKVLKNYLKDTIVKYVRHEIASYSENAEGFMGEHYKLIITYEKEGKEDVVQLFVKTKPVKNKAQAEIANSSPLYIKEIFLYDYLFPEFEKYGYDTSFAAKSYYCIENQTLIMEDLTLQNYLLHARHEKFNLEETKCLLKSLALYHAAGFAYQRQKSLELGREYNFGTEFPKEFEELFFHKYIEYDYERDDRFWNGNYIMIDKLIDVLPKDETYKQQFKQLVKEADFCKTFVQDYKLPKTCGHGDLWSNNMLFKYSNNDSNKQPEKCCLVDFQISRYNTPCIDVILAIYSNTSAELRSQHLEELYQYYYDTLSAILTKYGHPDVLSLKQYRESIEIFRHEVLCQVLTVNSIIYIPKKVLTESVQKDDDSFENLLMNKEDHCVESFKNDPAFNQVMSESLYDLYDALLVKLRK